jgi:hypothetical protein
MGSSGGPKDEETFVREIKLAALEQKVRIGLMHKTHLYTS